MAYTISTTKVEKVDHKFSPEAQLALDRFKRLNRAEKLVKRLENELQEYVNAMPADDVFHYNALTNSWMQEEEWQK